MTTERECANCGVSFTPKRPHARCCSTRCRQALHRFETAVGRAAVQLDASPMRLAYADPPYPGLSKRYYSDHPDYAGEVDHAALIASLAADFDGWALSTSARALPMVLGLCPPGVRVAAWLRGERPTRAHGPLNAWEPVIFMGGRADPNRVASSGGDDASRDLVETRREDQRDGSRGDRSTRRASTPDASARAGETRRVDALATFDHEVYVDGALAFTSRPRTTDPRRVIGAKPAVFSRWVFELLGAQPGDTFVDVFPGSGGVARAWEVYTSPSTHRDRSTK